eukprot:1542144-Alexandrium_andersonii.AAC.1
MRRSLHRVGGRSLRAGLVGGGSAPLRITRALRRPCKPPMGRALESPGLCKAKQSKGIREEGARQVMGICGEPQGVARTCRGTAGSCR